MSITADEIKKVVLSEDDFGFEMRVGNILKPENVKYPELRNAHASIMPFSHGGTYKDQVTEKTRQFDYRFQIIRTIMGSTRILFAVECKNLNPDLPIVVCGRPRTKGESYHVYIAGHGALSKLFKVEGISSIYKPNNFVGKSLLRLKIKDRKLCAEGESEIYDRWSQALASSHDLARDAAYKAPQSFAFVMPVVVVPDDALWQVSYKDNGEPESAPAKIDQCEFYADQKIPIGLPFVITHIHFVTLKGLSQMLANFANADYFKWDEIFSRAASEFNS
jgi:hypothetical protein